ncbi:TPA: hypothetical protein ACJPOS_000539 [Streptococcus pyogenes]
MVSYNNIWKCYAACLRRSIDYSQTYFRAELTVWTRRDGDVISDQVEVTRKGTFTM